MVVWVVMGVGVVGLMGKGSEVGKGVEGESEREGEVVAVVEGVKATAYSVGSRCNGEYAGRTALGGRLKAEGEVRSAAADWSKWPVGTRFRVRETGQVYVVEDYGRALVGTETLDLCKGTEVQVVRWGVRRVTVEVLEWGSKEKSLRILEGRKGSWHVRRMVEALRREVRGRDEG